MTTQRGFTLIELAIVLVIITILIGGLAVPLSAQIQARRIAETNKTLEEAREVAVGYAMTHSCSCAYTSTGSTGTLIPATPTPSSTTCLISSCPTTNPSSTAVILQHRYLPCPDTDNDGNEDRGLGSDLDACKAPVGWLPWVTLGTASQDAWGNRLLYAVNGDFAHRSTGFSTTTPSSTASPPTTTAQLGICNTHTCGTPNVAANVAFVVMSHGANGRGALNVNSLPPSNALLAPPDPLSLDEIENLDTDATYISRTHTKPGDVVNGVVDGGFDDILVWVPEGLLKARICPPSSDCSP